MPHYIICCRHILLLQSDLKETQEILDLIREEEARTTQLKSVIKAQAKLLAAADALDENGVAVEQSFNREQVQEQEQVCTKLINMAPVVLTEHSRLNFILIESRNFVKC